MAGSRGREETILIVGDVHLLPVSGEGQQRFARFLRHASETARRLYLLGDIFDVWTGPRSANLPGYRQAGEALRAAADRGLAMIWVPGNRDFNLDGETAGRMGMRVSGDLLSAGLPSGPALLTHGDLFLSEDHAYQRLRTVLRSAPMRWLARHLPARLAAGLAEGLRRRSRRAIARKDVSRMRIVPETVEMFMGDDLSRAVCGHVHHAERIDLGGGRELWTLGAFEEGGFYLCDAGEGLRHEKFEG